MQVSIDEGFSFEEGTKQFIRIKDCFFDTISGHGYDFQGINYIDLTRKFNWIVKHDAGNQPCSRDFSIERYALSMMKMPMTSKVSDDSEFWINDKWHCMWPGVKCSEGFVVGLDLAKIEGIRENTRHCMRPDVECNENALEYFVAGLDLTEIESISEYTTIFNEIGLLTNLKRLDFSYEGLAGSIPSEVGLLTQLPYLSLENNILTGSIPTEVGLLTDLTYLSLRDNELTGSIPTQVGALTKLKTLYLCKQLFSALLLCFETKQIRYYSNFNRMIFYLIKHDS
jgi:hypothetical protein